MSSGVFACSLNRRKEVKRLLLAVLTLIVLPSGSTILHMVQMQCKYCCCEESADSKVTRQSISAGTPIALSSPLSANGLGCSLQGPICPTVQSPSWKPIVNDYVTSSHVGSDTAYVTSLCHSATPQSLQCFWKLAKSQFKALREVSANVGTYYTPHQACRQQLTQSLCSCMISCREY